jgi:hypothetical protein
VRNESIQIKQNKMKSQTTKKLLAFITMIIFSVLNLFFFSSCQKEINTRTKTNDSLKTNASSSSSIVYTDVVPDSIFHGATYNLDLNNDGIYDFKFSTNITVGRCSAWGTSSVNTYASVSSIGSQNAILVSGTYPGALDTNTVIGNRATWSSSSGQTLKYISTCYPPRGNWSTSEDKYLGLKIKKDRKILYGWIRLSVNMYGPGPSIVVRDYAYNSTSTKQILAGQIK